MITLITGLPGSGKSAAAVERLLAYAAEGRKIYADGVPDLAVSHEPLPDPRQWHVPGVVDDGAVIFIDEAQRVWRAAASGSKVPPDIEALETHRHRGLDFILVTQHPSFLHAEVRRLAGPYVHLRDVGMLGRWWYEWPEVTAPETFKSAPIKKRYLLPKKVFTLYKSASLHVKPVRSVPRMVLIAGAAVVAFGLLAWRAVSSVSSHVDAAKAPASSASGPIGRGQQLAVAVGTPGAGRLGVSPPVPDREPFAGVALHIAGQWMQGAVVRSVFSASMGGRVVATIADRELFQAGYAWRQYAPCTGVLIFKGQERAVFCDAPAAPRAALPVSPPASAPAA